MTAKYEGKTQPLTVDKASWDSFDSEYTLLRQKRQNNERILH